MNQETQGAYFVCVCERETELGKSEKKENIQQGATGIIFYKKSLQVSFL